jgi:hypothetical protein
LVDQKNKVFLTHQSIYPIAYEVELYCC